MKIGIDASRANSKEKTGVEWYSYNLINALKNIDNKNQYILYSQDELRDDLKILPDNFKSKVLKWPFKKFWTQIRLWLQSNIDKNTYLFIPAGIIPLILFKNFKIITTIHDIAFLRYPEYFSKKELILQKIGLKLAVLFASKIITISNFSKEEIIKYTNCNPTKIYVAHLGYNNKKFFIETNEQIREEIKKKYDLPNKFLLYIGRIEEKKNIINQIIAFQKFRLQYPQYYFVLIGKHGYRYNEIKQELIEKNLYQNIIELGWVDGSDMNIILNLSSIFVYVTNYEGFGLPILEAQACGTPVITAENTSQKEVSNDSVLYSMPEDIEKIYQNIIDIIENKDNIKNILINRGLENIKRFSWKKCSEETLEIINKQ